jgi:hypothetical protein
MRVGSLERIVGSGSNRPDHPAQLGVVDQREL